MPVLFFEISLIPADQRLNPLFFLPNRLKICRTMPDIQQKPRISPETERSGFRKI
jgi:hypothetical protein